MTQASQELPTEPTPEPKPRATFDALPLSDEVRRALDELGYKHPTPVQLAVWDPATRGKDAVVQAQTGTGKTASFGLPIIDHVIKRASEGVQALVLCPTRELAVQVSQELERIAKYRETKIIAIYGGASIDRQVDAIKAGAQVVVGTPGRVLDHLRRGTLDAAKVRLLVLDEADEMLSMGFERELTAILDHLPKTRQTLLFSATVPPDIERISRSRLKEPEFLTLSGDHIGALSITHYVYMISSEKITSLARIIETENPESAVVFCNTKDATQAVAEALSSRGFDADWLNGDLAQNEREEVMRRTKEGKLRFLVATDVAARGIDISHLTHVINYDFPQDAETYVHRTGRTGRAGRTGTAIALITPQDIGGLYLLRLTYKIKPIERSLPSAVELKTRAETDLLAMMAEAMLPKGTHEDDRALARRLLSHDQAEAILAGLLREFLGVRPTAQDDASQARRTTVRRATLKRRGDRSEPQIQTAPERPVTGDGTMAPRVEREPRPRMDAPREPRVDAAPREPRVDAAPRPRMDAPREPRVDAAPREPRVDAAPREPRVDAAPREPRIDAAPREPRIDAPPREARPPREPRVDGPREPRADAPRDARVDGPLRDARGDGPPRDAREPRPRLDGRDRAPERPRLDGRDRDRRPEPRQPTADLGPTAPRGPRHRDFASWSPPDEEGDDQPILAKAPQADATPVASSIANATPVTATNGGGDSPSAAMPDADFTELFIGVGRREGARAQDLLKVLVETGGVDKDVIRRIRVRDRHTFVAVPKGDAAKVITNLSGQAICGKDAVLVEVARDQPNAS